MVNEVTLLPKKELIEQVGQKLETMLHEQLKAFPKEFNETRFLQNCLTVLADTKDIELCRPMSVVRTLIKGAFLNLDFFRKECYVIVYNNNIGTKEKPVWVKDASFQTDYKGEVKLAKKYGKQIKDIYAKVVQEGDVLEIGVEKGLQFVNFTPKPFNDKPIIGVFAVVYLNDGTMRCETMSVKDVNDVREGYSKSADGPSWKKSWPEMAKAKVIRRACKTLDLDFDSIEQQKAYEEGSGDDLEKLTVRKEAPKVDDPFVKQVGSAAAPVVQDAEVVVDNKESNADRLLRAEFEKRHPGEDPWQIDIRIKEFKESAA